MRRFLCGHTTSSVRRVIHSDHQVDLGALLMICKSVVDIIRHLKMTLYLTDCSAAAAAAAAERAATASCLFS
jgi:hypothetical protein